MPAALEVVDGMAGHTSTSAAAKPIARPREFDPHTVSNLFAMRSPNPVRSKPCIKPYRAHIRFATDNSLCPCSTLHSSNTTMFCILTAQLCSTGNCRHQSSHHGCSCHSRTFARRNEITTNHTTVLFAAANISLNSKVCVVRPTEAPKIAQAPLGKGDRINPQMTATNNDKSDQACRKARRSKQQQVGVSLQAKSPRVAVWGSGSFKQHMACQAGAHLLGPFVEAAASLFQCSHQHVPRTCHWFLAGITAAVISCAVETGVDPQTVCVSGQRTHLISQALRNGSCIPYQ